jgi:hypothetical protein
MTDMQETTTKNHATSPSPVRRQLLGGLLGASAVVALAPTHWSKPVVNRVLTPAHGQAVSIAAGTYTAFGVIDDVGGCVFVVEFAFDWPGGAGPTQVEPRPLAVEYDCETFSFPIGEVQWPDSPSATIVVTNDPDSVSGSELAGVSPPLPVGFFFVVTDFDFEIDDP